MVVKGVSGELLENVNTYLSIRALEEQGVSGEARLRWLHARAESQIRDALSPFGFYHPTVQSSLEPSTDEWLASYRIKPGEPVRIRSKNIRITGEGSQDAALAKAVSSAPIRNGQRLVHSEYEQTKSTLQSLALARGYFDGQFTTSRVAVDLARKSADVTLLFDTGARYQFGSVTFEQDFLDPELLYRYQEIEPGRHTSPASW